VPGACQALSFWLKGDASGHGLEVRVIDATGALYERRLGPIDWDDWRRVDVGLEPGEWRQLARYGEERHPIVFPLTLDSLCLTQSSQGPAMGQVLFADLRARTDVEPVDLVDIAVTTGQKGDLFYRPREVRLSASLGNRAEEAVSGTLTLDLRDFFGAERRVFEGPISLAPGEQREQTIAFEQERLGVYRGALTLSVGGRERSAPVRFAVSEEREPTPADPESPFGVNFLTTSFPRGPEREWALKLGAEAGIKWERTGFQWAAMESSPGQFAWQAPGRTAGVHGKALEFSGSAARFAVPGTEALRAPATRGELSLELRLRLSRLDYDTEWHTILAKARAPGGGQDREYLFFYRNSTHQLALSFGDQQARWSDLYCDKRDWLAGRWYHLVATHTRATGETRWYVDGEPAGVATAGYPTLFATDGPLMIGPTGTGLAFALDDLRIYDRVLTAEQARALARGEQPAPLPVAAYDFDEDGPAIRDSVGASNGEYLGPAVDGVIEDSARYGVSVLGIVGFPPRWASTAPEGAQRPSMYEPEPGAFEDYCRALTAHYADRVRHWEIWNEPNIQVFWEPQPDAQAYARTLAAAYRGCKAGDPDCKVVGVSLAGGGKPQLDFVEQVFAAGGGQAMDLLSLHPYRYPQTPEDTDLVGDMRYAYEIGERHGGGKRLWLTEIGWPKHRDPRGSSDAWEALMVPRSYLEALASGVVDTVFWFRFHDSGTDTSYLEHWCGLVDQDLGPNPSYFAYRSMALTLEGQKLRERLDLGPGLRAYLFEGRGKRTLALWAMAGRRPVALGVALPRVTVMDLMGNAREVATHDGAAVIEAGPAPVYVPNLPERVVARAAAAFEPEQVTLGRGETVQARLVVANVAAGAVRFRVIAPEVPGVQSQVEEAAEVAPGGEATIQVRLTAQPKAEPGRRTLTWRLVGPAGEAAVDLAVVVTSARRDAPPVAAWSFDEAGGEVARDSGGGGHDATLLDGARFTRNGKRGGALELPATQARAEVADAPGLTLNDEVTVMCWVKVTGPNGQWQAPILKALGDEVRNYGIYLGLTSGEVHFTTTWEDMGRGHADPGCGRVVWDGEWHHLAATFSKHTQRLRTYVDGEPAREYRVDRGGLMPAAAPVVLGQGMGGPAPDGGERPAALLDEVAIYPRELTAEEVAAAAR